MGISLFIIFVLIIILYFKTKTIKEQTLHERLVADNQNIKNKAKESKNVRKDRINFDERELDFRMEKSSSIILNKAALAEMKKDNKKILEFK